MEPTFALMTEEQEPAGTRVPPGAVATAVAGGQEARRTFDSAAGTATACDAARSLDDWIQRATGRWWVLHTRARNEKRVAAMLAEQQVRHYLPLVTVRHTYSKAKVAFDVPLFPGYVFLCGDPLDCEKARKTNRIAGILPVENQERLRTELWNVRRVVESGAATELYPALQAGQRCRITRGALQGVEGIVVRNNGRSRMYLSVSTLGQCAMVEVDPALLEAIT